MSKWQFKAVERWDDITLDAVSNDDTGQMTGTIRIGAMQFDVTGVWAAAGSVPGRKNSAIALSGSCKDRITTFVTLNGTIDADMVNIESVIVLTFTDPKYRQRSSGRWTSYGYKAMNEIYHGHLSGART